MRRTELLITQARRATENQDYNESTGISDEEYIQYLNDAQDRLYSLIQSMFPKLFQKEYVVALTADQEAVDLPADLYNSSRIENVEYSHTGNAKDYFTLDNGVSYERLNGSAGLPCYYIRRSTQILLQPKNQSGSAKVRMEYQKNILRLDKRRGKVTAVTLNTGTSEITSLTLDTTTLNADDITAVQDAEYGTIVNRLGTVQMAALPIESIDSSTGVVTLFSGFTYDTGETIAVGDYLCVGPYSSTHSELPDTCERYFIVSAQHRVLGRDSSSDQNSMKQTEVEIEGDILQAFAKPDGESHVPPIDDDEFLTFY